MRPSNLPIAWNRLCTLALALSVVLAACDEERGGHRDLDAGGQLADAGEQDADAGEQGADAGGQGADSGEQDADGGDVDGGHDPIVVVRHIDAFVNTPKPFRLVGTDVDGDGSLASISQPCAPSGTARGTIQVVDEDGLVVTTLGCGGSEALDVATSYTDPTSGTRSWYMLYTPAVDDSGADIKSISITLRDTGPAVQDAVAQEISLVFSVFRENASPSVSLADDIGGTAVGDAIPFAFTAFDSDMIVDGVLSDAFDLHVVIDYDPSVLTLASTDGGLDVSARPFESTAGAGTTNIAMNSLYFVAHAAGDFEVTVHVDDQGNTGYCPLGGDEDRLIPCARSITKVVTLHVTD